MSIDINISIILLTYIIDKKLYFKECCKETYTLKCFIQNPKINLT